MSLITAFILPLLEKELIAVEPQVQEFLLTEIKVLGNDIVKWAEYKIQNKLTSITKERDDG